MRGRVVGSDGGGPIGPFCWVPSITAGLANGQPDAFLGNPIYTSTNVASMASDAKVLAFGDFSRYVAREVGGLRLERSTDAFFAKNQLAVRGVSRLDAALVDATAVVHLHQAVT